MKRKCWRGALIGAAGATLLAGAAAAEEGLCDMEVFDSNRGAVSGPAEVTFKELDQFVVCFRPTADGYVTLWDRMPTEAEVERLVPNANFHGEGNVAAKVEGGERRCFGTGADGYYLQMDPQDGDGLGMMWLVFTETEEDHPLADSFTSSNQFAASFKRFGAGAIETDRDGADNAIPPADAEGGACTPKKSLSYSYVVQTQ